MDAHCWLFVFIAAFSGAVPLLLHFLISRVTGAFRAPAQRQKGAILAFLAGYLPVGGAFLAWVLTNPGARGNLLDAGYLAVVYTGFGYTYFHLFNMSETARRIRILAQGDRSGKIGLDQLAREYTREEMIDIRLRRLVALGEILREQDRVRRGRMLLLIPARIVFGFRSLIFPQPERWERNRANDSRRGTS